MFSTASGFRLALLQFGGLPAYGCLWSATAFPTSSLASSHDRWISRGVLLRTRRPREASGAHWGPWTSFRSPLWKGCSCSLLSRSEPCRPLRCLPICPSLSQARSSTPLSTSWRTPTVYRGVRGLLLVLLPARLPKEHIGGHLASRLLRVSFVHG